MDHPKPTRRESTRFSTVRTGRRKYSTSFLAASLGAAAAKRAIPTNGGLGVFPCSGASAGPGQGVRLKSGRGKVPVREVARPVVCAVWLTVGADYIRFLFACQALSETFPSGLMI